MPQSDEKPTTMTTEQALPMSLADYLLSHLIQECAEVIVEATKAQHFGLLNVEPNQTLTNQERLLKETIDLEAILELCERYGILPADSTFNQSRFEMISEKMSKAADFRVKARQLGRLER